MNRMCKWLPGNVFITLLFLLGAFGCASSLQSLDDYNVVWTSPSQNSSESMPVGGRDTGLNVWVENGDILFYVHRSGSLNENGEYLKLGRVRLRLVPNPFKDYTSFRQELKLRQSTIEIKGTRKLDGKEISAQVQIWLEIDSPVIHIDVDSDDPVQVLAFYENWRTEDAELPDGRYGARFGCFSLEGYPGKVIRFRDQIEQTPEGILFYHRNPDDSLTPDVFIKQQGLEDYKDQIYDDIQHRTFGGMLMGENFVYDGVSEGQYLLTPYKAWKIRSEKAAQKHRLLLVSHIEQTESPDTWKKHLKQHCRQAKRNESLARKKMLDWWDGFWDRSWIVPSLKPTDKDSNLWHAGRNYQLFRYQLGCNAFGEYPTKFNGGNFTFDPSLVNSDKKYSPDWRQWGGAFHTAQNQRLVYWPMLKSGDSDCMKPQFELYRKGLPGARARVKEHFGHGGAVFSEYAAASGVAIGSCWGWSDNTSHRRRGQEIPFGDPRADATHGYGSLVEKGVMANPMISYHWESQVEHAYMLLEANRYTGMDISAYLPFIKESLVFFDEHYQKRRVMRGEEPLDGNGKLVIYPSTACESFKGATNPNDLCAGLAACLDSIAKQDVGFSKEDIDYFAGLRKRIPDINFGKTETGDPMAHPAEKYRPSGNVECPQFYPLFPFNRYALGRDDIEAFHNAWKYGKFARNMVISWHQDGIFMARMGLAEEAAKYNLEKLADSPRRFPTFWGPGHDWVPDHNWGGTGMLGLQEMLMQTVDDKIVLLPAWPKEWDVTFKLHAPDKTVVEGTVKNGQVKDLKVSPRDRLKDIEIYKQQ